MVALLLISDYFYFINGLCLFYMIRKWDIKFIQEESYQDMNIQLQF